MLTAVKQGRCCCHMRIDTSTAKVNCNICSGCGLPVTDPIEYKQEVNERDKYDRVYNWRRYKLPD